jgi:hypothetical protein
MEEFRRLKVSNIHPYIHEMFTVLNLKGDFDIRADEADALPAAQA